MFLIWFCSLRVVMPDSDGGHGTQQLPPGCFQQEVGGRLPLREGGNGSASPWMRFLRSEPHDDNDDSDYGCQTCCQCDTFAHRAPTALSNSRQGEREFRSERFFLPPQGREAGANVVFAENAVIARVIARHGFSPLELAFAEVELCPVQSECGPCPGKS